MLEVSYQNSLIIVISLMLLSASLLLLYNIERSRFQMVGVSSFGEWALIVACAVSIALTMYGDVNWVDWTVSLIFLATGSIHIRILRLIRKAKADTTKDH